MDSTKINTDAADGRHIRRPYSTPTLIAHGTLEQITQEIGKNSGTGDADSQSGGAG